MRAPIDDVPFGHGGIVHDFWEGPRHIVVDGVFLITSTRVMDQVVVIRNQMEETLRTCLRSILQTDASFVWTPQGQSARTLQVRNDVQYDSTHTDGYLLESFHFGLVAADPDWDGFVSNPDWSDLFNAQSGLLIDAWSATHDYFADLVLIYPAWGTGAGESFQFLRPAGFTDIFVTQAASGQTSGGSEPNWASAPNIGDVVFDNDYTWANYGPLGNFPPILNWIANTLYHNPGCDSGLPSAVTPPTSNGHVYVLRPDLCGLSGPTEPGSWDTSGDFTVDAPSLAWLDMGPVP